MSYHSGELSIELIISTNNETLTIEYKDNGVGVQEDDPQSIFQPFYTTKRQHAASKGLGLYYTHNLITEIIQGHVSWPENPVGFHLFITLPIEGYYHGDRTHFFDDQAGRNKA